MTELPKGDCFKASVDFMVNNPDIKQIVTLVHAEVRGRGPIEGIRMGHSWVELGDYVIDVANGKRHLIKKELYYQVAEIDKSEGKYIRYSFDEMIENVLENKTYGHWELNVKQ